MSGHVGTCGTSRHVWTGCHVRALSLLHEESFFMAWRRCELRHVLPLEGDYVLERSRKTTCPFPTSSCDAVVVKVWCWHSQLLLRGPYVLMYSDGLETLWLVSLFKNISLDLSLFSLPLSCVNCLLRPISHLLSVVKPTATILRLWWGTNRKQTLNSLRVWSCCT